MPYVRYASSIIAQIRAHLAASNTSLAGTFYWGTGLGPIAHLLGPTDQSLKIIAAVDRALTVGGHSLASWSFGIDGNLTSSTGSLGAASASLPGPSWFGLFSGSSATLSDTLLVGQTLRTSGFCASSAASLQSLRVTGVSTLDGLLTAASGLVSSSAVSCDTLNSAGIAHVRSLVSDSAISCYDLMVSGTCTISGLFAYALSVASTATFTSPLSLALDSTVSLPGLWVTNNGFHNSLQITHNNMVARAMNLNLSNATPTTHAGMRIRGYSPSYELRDKDDEASWSIGLDDDNSNSLVIGSDRCASILSASTRALLIDTSGNVGFKGVTAPAAACDVGGNSVCLLEISEPSAPAANKVLIFAMDNGSSKTKLMAKFSSGAAQQLAIQP